MLLDAAVEDVRARQAPDGNVPVDAAPCPTTAATTLLGGASPIGTHFQLTRQSNNLAGGIASSALVSLADFDVSFAYSLTHTASSAPAAGVVFFVIAAPATDLECRAGPYLCTLGSNAPGFAVILRTSKGVASDPAVPYVAVVDATAYPSQQPTSRADLDPSQATTVVPVQDDNLPSASTFHRMAISVRAGKVSVSIDGASILSGVVIPGYVPGRMSTWGIGGSTGQGDGFGHRSVVGQVSFDLCP